jgi:SAM-dependent methyltransferase
VSTFDVLPPGRGERFREMGQAFLSYFVELGGLRPDARMLDVGCGFGRMAIPLTGYLASEGSYEGFDIIPERVRWCAEHISVDHPNFRFHHANIFNKQFNPKGSILGTDYRLPYPDGHFNFVLSVFVFSNMAPDDIAHYFEEIARVTRAGGRFAATFFLLNDESLGLIRDGRSQYPFDLDFGIYRGGEGFDAVAHDERFVFSLYERFGMKIRDPVHYGAWAGRSTYLTQQDLVFAERL